jgi:hypothetical protein
LPLIELQIFCPHAVRQLGARPSEHFETCLPSLVHTVVRPGDWHEHEVPKMPSVGEAVSEPVEPHVEPHSESEWQVVKWTPSPGPGGGPGGDGLGPGGDGPEPQPVPWQLKHVLQQ